MVDGYGFDSPREQGSGRVVETSPFSIHQHTDVVALSIKNPEADRLARELAALTGESLTDAVLSALRERLARQGGRKHGSDLLEEVHRLQARLASLPVLDARRPDEILAYDENGLPR